MKEICFYYRCFWCLEDFFSNIKGVVATEVGYANGNREIVPEYHEVGNGETGYEEVTRVYFDESVLSVYELCCLFFRRLNPKKTYQPEEKELRENQSKILFVDYWDEAAVKRAKEDTERSFDNPMLTKIEPLQIYYRAEEEHQHYFKKHPEEAACSLH